MKISLMIPDEVKDYFDEQVKTLGIARNGLIVMALKQYVDQQKALKDMGGLPKLIEQLKDIQNQTLKPNE